MTEEELREMFAALEAQGLRPMLCDTPVAVYDGRVPCGTPTLSYGEIVSMAKLPQGLLYFFKIPTSFPIIFSL